jgi:hypothetical protein
MLLANHIADSNMIRKQTCYQKYIFDRRLPEIYFLAGRPREAGVCLTGPRF